MSTPRKKTASKKGKDEKPAAASSQRKSSFLKPTRTASVATKTSHPPARRRGSTSQVSGLISPINWPQSLINEIARRWVVIVVGSGVSCQSRNDQGEGPKSWSGFLDAALAEQSCKPCASDVRKLLQQNDYLTACEVIKETMGPDFTELVKREFALPGFKVAPLHRHIVGLDSRFVLTPNFDKIYDTCANQIRNSSVLVKSYHEEDVADIVRSRDRCILKVHGTIDSPFHMIFSRSEYARARSQFRSFYAIVEALILTHTFLFIGCGLDDPDIRLLLEDYAFRYLHAKPHYFVIPNDRLKPQVASVVGKSLNVKFLTYDPKGSHSQLVKAMDALKVHVDFARLNLANSGDW